MQGLVALVLLLCCVNVSGLMMSKLHERQHEFAVRTAIGAGRLRLVRQYLAESFVIALAGAALGAAVAWYGTSLLLPFFRHPNMGTGLSVQPDHTVFAVSAGPRRPHHAVLRHVAGLESRRLRPGRSPEIAHRPRSGGWPAAASSPSRWRCPWCWSSRPRCSPGASSACAASRRDSTWITSRSRRRPSIACPRRARPSWTSINGWWTASGRGRACARRPSPGSRP